jgi:hypothetical protein
MLKQNIDEIKIERVNDEIENSASILNTVAIQEHSQNPLGNVLRLTKSIAQYDVSIENPNALANLGKAIAGSLDRDDFTYLDPEMKAEVRLGNMLVTVDLSNPDEIVLSHRDTAGMGTLGNVFRSISYLAQNPIHSFAMKGLGIVADPELIYKQKVIQLLAHLDQEGLFGQTGASTFNLLDWEFDTRSAWRDVVIRRAQNKNSNNTNQTDTDVSLSEAFFGSFRMGNV